MREIKFRAWVKTACFGEGLMIHQNSDTDYGMVSNGEGFGVYNPDNDWLKNNEFEVMQYTGLKDNKRTEEYPEGQEIFEGDIVRNGGYPELCVVEFHEGQYIGRYAEDSYIGLGFYVRERNSITVIGNIHENPELLEG